MKVETLKWIKCFTRSELDPVTRHLLHALSMYMNKEGGGCFPSIELLVRDTGLARSTVCERIKLACEKGWLMKSKHKGQQWVRNAYQATVPKGSPGNGLEEEKERPPHGIEEERYRPPHRKTPSATPTLTTQGTKKKEITKVISQKEKVPISEVEVQHVEEWARENIPGSIKLAWELGKFKDYWSEAKRKPPENGVIAFRNWLRKATEYQERAAIAGKNTAKHKDFHTQDYYANTDGFITE